MSDHMFGVIEMTLSFGLAIGFCLWQLWDVRQARKKSGGKDERNE